MLRRWLSLYQRALRDHPIKTNVISGALVMLAGDTIAQSIEIREKRKYNPNTDASFDHSRTAVMCSWSAIGDVPINLMLFSAINRAMSPLGIPAVASLPQSLLKGVCFFVPGVIIRMPCFIFYVTTAEHFVSNIKADLPLSANYEECMATIGEKMHASLLTIFDRGAKLWIPVNTLTFFAVPEHYRPLTLSCVTVGWMTYLSLMQHKDIEDDRKKRLD